MLDKVYQKAEDIENSMSKMEQQIKLIGGSHARRKSDGSALLIKHKPNISALMSNIDSYSVFNNSPDNRSALTAQIGQRNKVTRLMLK